MSRKLRRVIDLPTAKALERHGIITCKDVLATPRMDISEITNMTEDAVHEIVMSAARAIAPTSKTALQKAQGEAPTERYLPTTLAPLDFHLGGGILRSTITEIAGPCGCGKTQFATLVALSAVKSGLPEKMSGVIYIDTEGAFSAMRLVEMARSRFPDEFYSTQSLKELTQAVKLFVPDTMANFLELLKDLEETVIEIDACLIVVDSIASLARKEYGTDSIRARTDALATEASILKDLATTFSVPILVTNQVTTKVSSDESTVIAALGNTWAHSVNTRLVVEYGQNSRCVRIVKSPVVGLCECRYIITDAGPTSVDDSEPSKTDDNQRKDDRAKRTRIQPRSFFSDPSLGVGQQHTSVLQHQ